MQLKTITLALSLLSMVSAVALPPRNTSPSPPVLRTRKATLVAAPGPDVERRQASTTLIWGDPFGGSNGDFINYERTNLTLPFPITIYEASSSTIWIHLGGFISFEEPGASNHPHALPAYEFGDHDYYYIPKHSVLPLMRPYAIWTGKNQGVYYTVAGTSGSRTITFVWVVSDGFALDTETHFEFKVIAYEDNPGVFTYEYDLVDQTLVVDNLGALVGVQSYDANKYEQYYYLPASEAAVTGVSTGDTLRAITVPNAV